MGRACQSLGLEFLKRERRLHDTWRALGEDPALLCGQPFSIQQRSGLSRDVNNGRVLHSNPSNAS